MDCNNQIPEEKIKEQQAGHKMRPAYAQHAQGGDQEQLTDLAVESGREDASLNAQSLPHIASSAAEDPGATEDGADTGGASPGTCAEKEFPFDILSPDFQADESDRAVQMKTESKGVESKNQIFVRPRPFKYYDDWEYEQGILKAVESGDYMLSRAVEFKFQGGCPPEGKKAFLSFFRKSFEFICGLLNSKKNGTIYFGIADKTDGLCYGEIYGIEMDLSLCAKYYEDFHMLLPKCFPDNFELVRLCIAGPKFVLIKNTPHRWIIEIDIEPAYNQTKEEMFFFNPEPIREKYDESWTKSEKKAEKKKNYSGFFRRDGSETQQIDKSEVEFFRRAVLPRLAEKRKQEEDAH